MKKYDVRLNCPKYMQVTAESEQKAIEGYLKHLKISKDDVWAEEVMSEAQKVRLFGLE